MAITSKLGDFSKLSKERFRTTITLVSRGYSAPDVFKDGKLTILPWDLSVNEWLHTKSAAANMSSLEITRNLLSRVTGLTLAQVDKLPLSETNLVLMVARSLTWPNSSVGYTPVCPHCRTVQAKASVRVPDELGRAGEKPENYPGYDVIVLPEAKDELKLRPLLVADGVLVESRDKLDRMRFSDRQAELSLAILEVNNGKPDTRDEMFSYLEALSPGDTEFIAQQMQDLSPRLDDRIPHKCDNEKCGREFTYTLDLNVDFFRR